MTRKDYILIAQALHDNRPIGSVTTDADRAVVAMHELIAKSLADALRRDNPRFDRDRFLKAAGVANG